MGKEYKKNIENSYVLLAIFIYSIIIEQFTSVNVYAARIAFTFSIFNCLFFPMILKFNKYKYKDLFNMGYICYLLIFWYYFFVYCGGSETVPYVLFK